MSVNVGPDYFTIFSVIFLGLFLIGVVADMGRRK